MMFQLIEDANYLNDPEKLPKIQQSNVSIDRCLHITRDSKLKLNQGCFMLLCKYISVDVRPAVAFHPW